jgi:hypothetical protein
MLYSNTQLCTLIFFFGCGTVRVLEDIPHSAHLLNLYNSKHTKIAVAVSLNVTVLYHVVSAIIAQHSIHRAVHQFHVPSLSACFRPVKERALCNTDLACFISQM